MASDPTLTLHERMAALAVFVSVVEAGSLTAAAERLALSKSAVSKQLARLEQALGVQLLRRTTRRLGLTDAGQAFFERAAGATALCREAHATVAELARRPQGLLRISAPVAWGKQVLAPLLPAFLDAHPGLRLRLHLSDRPVELTDEGYELAIRQARVLPEGLVARRLGRIDYLLCAAPALRLPPDDPQALLTLDCLKYGDGDSERPWRFLHPADGRRIELPVRTRLMVNSSEVLLAAALDGLGPALLPRHLAQPALDQGRLRRLLPGWEAEAPVPAELWAVWHPDRHRAPKRRAFVDFLAARLPAPEAWPSSG